MSMYYYTLTIDGMRMMIWTGSDPLQKPQRKNNPKKILWKMYKLYIIIMKADMQVYSIIYVIHKMIWMSMLPFYI